MTLRSARGSPIGLPAFVAGVALGAGLRAAPAAAALPEVPGAVFPLSGEATPLAEEGSAELPMTLAVNLAPLVSSTLQLRWELAGGAAWSWSLVAGGGRGRRGPDSRGWVAEAGAQLRWYLSGLFFKGLFLAAEADGLLAFGEGSRGEDALAAGPRVGFKLTGLWGLTLEAHLGAAYVRKTADGVIPGSTVVAAEVQPIAGLLVGVTW